jgi:hypothetical protein
MKYAVNMGSGAVICIPCLMKIDSGIQKLMGGGGSQTYRQHGEIISPIFLSN